MSVLCFFLIFNVLNAKKDLIYINGVPGLFPVQCCLESLGQHCIGFCLYHVVPIVLRQDWTKFFLVMLSGASRATLHNTGHYFSFFMFFLRNVLCRLLDNNASGVNLCNVFPRVLRQHWTRFFPVRCCLKPQGQYCIGFLSVNIVPRVSSHGTALHRKKLM